MVNHKLKIAVVVHGRFYAFELARELIRQGQKVTLFTNYPKWAVRHFGISPHDVRSFWMHGFLSRIMEFVKSKLKLLYSEAWLHKMFGRWAAQEVTKESWDVVYCWSGISEEILQALSAKKTLRILVRGSSHIRTQAHILEEEEKRTNMSIEHPSAWMIAREEREYRLTDYIVVLSKFAQTSFIEQGVKPQKLLLIPLGVSLGSFRPSNEIIENRCKRIIEGKPLRILYVGALSFRKGIWDMLFVAGRLKTGAFHFRFVGPVAKEAITFLKNYHHLAEFMPNQRQHELPKWYAWADMFIFSSIEEGYSVILAQAQASCLPILSTTNCCAPDIINEGKTGWVFPIRSPNLFIERLHWCNSNRSALVRMVRYLYNNFHQRDWSEVARDFVDVCVRILERRER